MTTDPRSHVSLQGAARAGEHMPGYNTPIPVQITTPDLVATRLGELSFADGVPTYPEAGKVVNREQGDALAKVLGSHRAVLMRMLPAQ